MSDIGFEKGVGSWLRIPAMRAAYWDDIGKEASWRNVTGRIGRINSRGRSRRYHITGLKTE